ncbi:MAG: decaprenyl-phosphate phosphoribosyltransferase [Myxococcota bacterium]
MNNTRATAPVRTPVSVLIAAVKQLRPKQWTKNAFLFAGLVFSGEFLNPSSVMLALWGFGAFCLLASSGYILNDYLDREADRKHPKKRFRPIASGALPESLAIVAFVVCLGAGAWLSWSLGSWFLAVAMTYLVTTLSYSYFFKHIVILDVMFLASGFVWRAVAGALAIGVAVSPWLFLCTAFFALFIGFNKRRAELIELGATGGTRKNLAEYGPKMLEAFQSITTTSTILCYSLYAVLGPTPVMALTIPFVLYGVFRYVYLVEQRGEGGAPDETALRDMPLIATVGLYVLTALAVLVARHQGLLDGISVSGLGG